MKNEWTIYETINFDIVIFIKSKGEILECIIENDDYDIVAPYNWYMNGGYVTAWDHGRLVRMHRLILDAPESKQVDHINRNPLDNRRKNLRLVTLQENLQNKNIYQNNKVGVRGVSFKTREQKWRATVSIGNGKQKDLGLFLTQEEAIEAVNSFNMGKG